MRQHRLYFENPWSHSVLRLAWVKSLSLATPKTGSCWSRPPLLRTVMQLQGTNQCYYMSLSFVSISCMDYIYSMHFFRTKIYLWDIKIFAFTSCQYSINVTESTWKCMSVFVKKKICIKIYLHAYIPARMKG